MYDCVSSSLTWQMAVVPKPLDNSTVLIMSQDLQRETLAAQTPKEPDRGSLSQTSTQAAPRWLLSLPKRKPQHGLLGCIEFLCCHVRAQVTSARRGVIGLSSLSRESIQEVEFMQRRFSCPISYNVVIGTGVMQSWGKGHRPSRSAHRRQ